MARCRHGVQWHDAGTVQLRRLRQLYATQQDVEFAPEVASYACYASSVAQGSLSRGEHLRMVSFRCGLDTAISVRCAFCGNKVTATQFQEACQYSELWTTILYTHLSYDLRRIVPEWSVSLPTYSGVLVQWGGGGGVPWFHSGVRLFLSGTNVSWITLSLSGRMLPSSEKAMVRHGATPKQVRAFMVAFWKAVLRMSRAPPPPSCVTRGIGSNQVTRQWRMKHYTRLGTFRQQGIG